MNFVNKLEKDLKFGDLLPETVKSATISSDTISSDTTISLSNLLWIVVIVIIIAMIIYCWCKNSSDNFNENVKDKFNQNKNENGNKTETSVMMLYNDNCPYSNKMKNELIKNDMKILGKKVKLVNFNSTNGNNLRRQYGIIGTPAIIKENSGEKPNILMGFTPIEEVEEKLRNPESNKTVGNMHPGVVNENNNNNDKILLIGNNHCGFCLKQKKFFEDKKISFKFIDSNSEEGMKYMRKYQANGVPLLVYMKDGKEVHNVGYTENFN